LRQRPKQALLSSSIVQGRGKRRGEGIRPESELEQPKKSSDNYEEGQETNYPPGYPLPNATDLHGNLPLEVWPKPAKASRDGDHVLEVFRGMRVPWRVNAIFCRQAPLDAVATASSYATGIIAAQGPRRFIAIVAVSLEGNQR